MTDPAVHPGRILGLLLAGSLLFGAGCVRRTIEITSTPSEALVWVNTREVGRTPVTFEFTYDGTYDVRLRRDGYKPVETSASTDPPLWDLPGFDFLAEIAPVEFDRSVQWHFDMELMEVEPAIRVERATAMRTTLEAWNMRAEAAARAKAAAEEQKEDFVGPPSLFGVPELPPDTSPGEAAVRPPELYPSGGGIQPDE